MNRSIVIAGLISAAVVAWVATGEFVWGTSAEAPAAAPAAAPQAAEAGGTEPKAAEPARPNIQRVRVAKLAAEPMTNEIVVRGRTAASRKATVASEVKGAVDQVMAERGASVKTGQPLIRIAIEERQAELNEARAMLSMREAEYAANQRLGEKGYRPELQVQQARANLDAARAMVKRAELDLANTLVKAPFDGVMAERSVELGDYVNVGGKLGTIVDLDPLKVVGQVSERAVGSVELGQIGKVRLIDGREVEGAVSYISPTANEQTRTFAVEVEVPNADNRIVEGLTAELRLPVGQMMAHRISPAVLSLADDGTVGVKLVNEQNIVEFRPVEVVGQAPDGVWLAGLPAEATIVVVGQDLVRHGQPVEPVLAETAGVQTK
ncbi:MAG TPA: efflux RND transporter periplasmic adaptor subunit [Alphaproteobacteria bacterium]|nr:efflux RND transporter periplasmic adaptor subunit [Alphaproteobacteria bacterium]